MMYCACIFLLCGSSPLHACTTVVPVMIPKLFKGANFVGTGLSVLRRLAVNMDMTRAMEDRLGSMMDIDFIVLFLFCPYNGFDAVKFIYKTVLS